MTVRTRYAARVLCLDADGRVLMTATIDPAEPDVTRWVAPGGGLEPGESAHDAACRELWEEVGLRVDDLGPAVATTWSRFSFDRTRYHQQNSWFAVRTPAFEPVPVALDSLEVAITVGTAWLHPDELDSVGGTHRVEPPETSTLAREAHERLAAAVRAGRLVR